MLNISDEFAEKLNMESRYTKEGVFEVKQKVAQKAAAKRREKRGWDYIAKNIQIPKGILFLDSNF